ncbi:class I SAM-dependent methyltransferase [Arthrobacter sp. NPDC058130]|uniref:class I SAM-dependent methyltransferase n=1 Tax=Arthrobacter sp. NPDC058130 TaxID=3346353 RepID=UPI0036F0FC3A
MANHETLLAVRSAYDTVAEAYSTVIPDTSFEAPLDLAMVDHFAAHMRATADRLVIDVGCGAGRMSSYLSHAGLNVSGVDLSPEMVRVAQRLHPGLPFEVGELTDLPAADASADGILAWYSVIHSPPVTLPAIAREFWRALRPGGSALIAFQAGSGHRTVDRAYGHDVQLRAELHAPDDVALRFTEQGFKMRAQLVRAPRSVEKHPQAAILVDKPCVPS